MPATTTMIADNHPRFPNQSGGHVESYFWRANHPSERTAFWLKATVLRPLQGSAVAEVWCATFDGDRTWATRDTVALEQASFEGSDPLRISIGGCRFELGPRGGSAKGELHDRRGQGERSWDLSWEIPEGPLFEPLCLYPSRRLVEGSFPKSKLLTPAPAMRFSGTMRWRDPNGDREVEVDGWYGMQGHNWGREHAYRYAWGQCLFLDAAGEPHCMLEGFSGKIKIGGILTPYLSGLVVRRGLREYRFDQLFEPWKQKAEVGDLCWSLRLRGPAGVATLRMEATPEQIACLGYQNPDDSIAYCLNSKLARTVIRVDPTHEDSFECVSEHGGALEFLQRDADPRFPNPA